MEAAGAKQRGVQAVQRSVGGGQHQHAAAPGAAPNAIELVEESGQKPLLDPSACAATPAA